jgi:hypothetical protein
MLPYALNVACEEFLRRDGRVYPSLVRAADFFGGRRRLGMSVQTAE